MTAQALSDVQAEHEQDLLAFEAAVERARYEAERSRRQFDAVEPENRLVARGLEAEWESRLKELARTEAALAERRSRRPVSLTSEETAWLDRAGADLRAVFDADSTTMTERKQLLRAVLSEVTLTVDHDTKQATARICFEGGAAIERTIRPQPARKPDPRDRRRHDRTGPPAGLPLQRHADRADPLTPSTHDRHRPQLHPSTSERPAPRPRDSRRSPPDHRGEERRGHR